ncbi:FAD-dependent monooxygenase OpS4 [Lachnellula arida]|uniref:FAD-dependent monooxygenase OpS4 n=1 Tax=Lachnellula arida TaxID=1316785 RepID=A0A8T9B276_9HELO|nr:FAD-dependent monooxygenase OpS4 [Lachnellula arida]
MAPPFHIIIVGAGICGLGAAISIALEGHTVSVFESAPCLHTTGAGIQITPNGVRILRRLGVAEELEAKVAIPETLSILRYDGKKLLAHRDRYDEEISGNYGEPIWCLHRIDLQNALAARAESLGVGILFDARVIDVDCEHSAIKLDGGRSERGHLIIAADGLWSTMRSSMIGRPLPPQPTNDLAYRILLTIDDVGDDEKLRDMISRPGIRIWMGPGAHAVAYSLLGGKMINIVLLVPNNLPTDTARGQGSVGEMVKMFEDWDPLLVRCLSHVKTVDKWNLMHLQVDEPWSSKQGTFVMAGDSCHPMLPYLAQGANLALEDGAVLGRLLGGLRSPAEIPKAMETYQKLRKGRVSAVRAETLKHQEEFHLPDGELQEARDQRLSKSFGVQSGDYWTHPKIQSWLFGYDVYHEADNERNI